jgi:tRNA A58 N-methylase Trm61
MLSKIVRFLRPAFVLLAVFIVLGCAIAAFQVSRTLQQLTIVETARDEWQRPADIIGALNLKPNSTVVDLGCGSGYFALKLSSAVNSGGTVLAIDIRRIPLAFLWFSSALRGQRNVRLTLADPDNSHLPQNAVNSVLIANTYHELDNPSAVLTQIFHSLIPGGRLVIADPTQTERGKLSTNAVESELRIRGFEMLSRDDQFLNQPGRRTWSLIVARKP